MTQVVVIEEQYDVFTFADEGIEVLTFNFHQYRDEIPSRSDLNMFRAEIDKVTNADARKWLDGWWAENDGWNRDSEKEEAEYKEEHKREQIALAHSILEEYGEE